MIQNQLPFPLGSGLVVFINVASIYMLVSKGNNTIWSQSCSVFYSFVFHYQLAHNCSFEGLDCCVWICLSTLFSIWGLNNFSGAVPGNGSRPDVTANSFQVQAMVACTRGKYPPGESDGSSFSFGRWEECLCRGSMVISFHGYHCWPQMMKHLLCEFSVH